MKRYEEHPYARVMPTMPKPDFETLMANIVENGLDQPIVLYQGKVLDGVHRLKACVLSGVKPWFVKLETIRHGGGDQDALAFVVSANLVRRHLTTSQRSAVGKELANMKEGRPKKTAFIKAVSKNGAPDKPPAGHVISQADAAKLMKVSRSSIQKAAKVARESPEKFAAVKAGKLSLNKALSELKPLPKMETPAQKKLNRRIFKLEEALTMKSPIKQLAELCDLQDGEAYAEVSDYAITIKLTPCGRAARSVARKR